MLTVLNQAQTVIDKCTCCAGLISVLQVIAPEEIVDPDVDDHSVMTYLSQFPKAKLKPGAPLRTKQLFPNKVKAYGPGVYPSVSSEHMHSSQQFLQAVHMCDYYYKEQTLQSK